MHAGDLYKDLTPFKHVIDGSSIVQEHRNITLSQGALASRCGWAALDAASAIEMPSPISVSGEALISVLASIPGEQDITLEASNGSLGWKAGSAKGKLAAFPAEPPSLLGRPKGKGLAASDELRRGFALGALSCPAKGAALGGVSGVAISAANDKIHFATSDNVTISHYVVTLQEVVSDGAWTISAKGAGLLESICRDGKLFLGQTHIDYIGPRLRAAVALIPPLKYDLLKVLGSYPIADESKIALPREQVGRFVIRALKLSEENKRCSVEIKVADGQVVLEFSEDIAQAEEYYIAEDIPKEMSCSIKVDALKLGRALDHCSHVVLEHVERKALVFTGEGFTYLVAGRS
jgi:hypothetical protein